jgi:hypothetical protein
MHHRLLRWKRNIANWAGSERLIVSAQEHIDAEERAIPSMHIDRRGRPLAVTAVATGHLDLARLLLDQALTIFTDTEEASRQHLRQRTECLELGGRPR